MFDFLCRGGVGRRDDMPCYTLVKYSGSDTVAAEK